jgi:hypothetical protein
MAVTVTRRVLSGWDSAFPLRAGGGGEGGKERGEERVKRGGIGERKGELS